MLICLKKTKTNKQIKTFYRSSRMSFLKIENLLTDASKLHISQNDRIAKPRIYQESKLVK